MPLSGSRFPELGCIQQFGQTEYGPYITASDARTCKIPLATQLRLRPGLAKLTRGKTPEPENFIDDDTDRKFGVIDHKHAGTADALTGTCAQHYPQIDYREYLATQIGKPCDPLLGSWYPRQ
jgi:hypothetical protein